MVTDGPMVAGHCRHRDVYFVRITPSCRFTPCHPCDRVRSPPAGRNGKLTHPKPRTLSHLGPTSTLFIFCSWQGIAISTATTTVANMDPIRSQRSRTPIPSSAEASSSHVAPAFALRSPWTQTRQRARSLVGNGDIEASLPLSATSLLAPLHLPTPLSSQPVPAEDYSSPNSSDDYSSSTPSSAPSSPLLTPVSPPRVHTASADARNNDKAQAKRWNLWSGEIVVPQLPFTAAPERPEKVDTPYIREPSPPPPAFSSRPGPQRARANSVLFSAQPPPGTKPLTSLVPPLASLFAVLSISTVTIFALIATLPNLRLPHGLSDVREQTYELRLYAESSSLAGWHVFGVLWYVLGNFPFTPFDRKKG
jgi:hypothetical protein